MDILYDLVEKTLQDPVKHLPTLLAQISSTDNAEAKGSLHSNSSAEYAIKRFIKATCSHFPKTKEHSAYALRVVLDSHIAGANIEKIIEFALENTDIKHAIKKT